jgi:hypothetical protein
MIAIWEIAGPSSYTQITVGTPPAGPTGGQVISAQALGLKAIEEVVGGLDNAGHYVVQGCQLGVGTGQFPNTCALIWIIAHTGAEESGTTNLSTFRVRLAFIGR